MTTPVLNGQVFTEDILKDKNIIDKNTGKPLKKIKIEKDKIVVVKEKGEETIPLNSLRGKAIYTRLTTGISEFTEPIYL
ncbi:MAG TPA: hypothetical protein EYP32_02285 [Aquificaceae bacterium]|nr:hypothetical protein [Aquificaceae bacterium]HIQ48545.1 hypothetical protein [Aquifex aeolicus]